MLVVKKELLQINDSPLETVPLSKFSVFSGIDISTLSLIRSNKRRITWKYYQRLLILLTNFANYGKVMSGGDKHGELQN